MSSFTKNEIEAARKDLERFKSFKDVGNNPLITKPDESYKIQIKIDSKVPPAKFINDTEHSHIWYANDLTFRAMKKDIFTLDTGIDDTALIIECTKCRKNIDKQFWLFCPFCEQSFKNEEQ